MMISAIQNRVELLFPGYMLGRAFPSFGASLTNPL
jgi:hypothetical protein